MGEDPNLVFSVGCPSIDLVARTDLGLPGEVLADFGRRHGVGSPDRP